MPKIDSELTISKYDYGMRIDACEEGMYQNQPVFLKNVNSSILGSWSTRNGYEKYGDTLQSGKSITGLFSQELDNGTKRLLATCNNSGDTAQDLYYYDTTWKTISGTNLTADAKTHFTMWLNQVFITGYDATGGNYNTTGELSNLTYGTTNLTSAPNAMSSIEYNDRLYLLNVEIDGDQYPAYSSYSSNPALDGSITWDPTITGMLAFGISDGGQIIGGAKGYGLMVIYKNNGTYISNGNNTQRISKYGTLSHQSIKNVGQNIIAFHWSTDRKVITLFNGEGLLSVSKQIEPILNGVTEAGAKNSVAGVKNGHYYLYVGDVTLTEKIYKYHKLPNTITNCMIDIDFASSGMTNPIISIYSLANKVTSMAEHNGELYFGSDDGCVYKFDCTTSDAGTPIESIVQTKQFYGNTLNQKNNLKNFKSVTVGMIFRKEAKVFASIDNGDWVELGDCIDKFTTFDLVKTFKNTIGYGIRIKITSNDTIGGFIHENIDITYDIIGVKH